MKMKKLTSNDKVYGILIKDIIRKECEGKPGIKYDHSEGYNRFTFFKGKDGKYYIDNFTYDFINENWFHRTYCEVIDGKEVEREILNELYGE